MRVSDNLSVAFRNLFKRKVRTALTLLAVAAATMLIVIVVALGIGMNRSFEESLKQMSDITKIQVYHNTGDRGMIVRDDIIAEIEKLEGVQTVTPIIQTYLYASIGKRRGSFQICGIRPEAMAAMGYPIADGRGLLGGGEWDVVFGANTPNEFRTAREQADEERKWRSQRYFVVQENAQSDSPGYRFDFLGEKMALTFDYNTIYNPNQSGNGGGDTATSGVKPPKPYAATPVGVLSGDSWEFAYQSYMPLETVKKIMDDRVKWEKSNGNRGAKLFKDTGYNDIWVKASDIKYVEGLVKQLTDMGFSGVWSPIDYINQMKQVSQNMQGFLGMIGGVVLFVAILMVANTMIMSIYERTREIGVMKVIGASLKDIRNLFLTEAAAIGLIGGVIGVGLSFGVAYVLKTFPDLLKFMQNFTGYGGGGVTAEIPWYLVAAALAGAMLVGLLSGYFPARRAMHVSALTAIQTQA